MRIYTSLMVVLLLGVYILPATAQDKFWLALGIHEGVLYELEVPAGLTGRFRQTMLSGDYKNYKSISEWEYRCHTKQVRNVEFTLLDEYNQEFRSEKTYGPWLKMKPEMLGYTALKDYWCK